jgi:hypothetical protein
MHEVLRRFDRETGWLAGTFRRLDLSCHGNRCAAPKASEGASQPPVEDDGSWR